MEVKLHVVGVISHASALLVLVGLSSWVTSGRRLKLHFEMFLGNSFPVHALVDFAATSEQVGADTEVYFEGHRYV